MLACCSPTARLGLRSRAPLGSSRAGAALARAALPAAQRRRAAGIVCFKDEDKPAEAAQEQCAPAEAGFDLGPGIQVSPMVPAFTRRREHLVARVAMLGFGASIVGELLTGLGPVRQLSGEIGVSPGLIYTVALGLMVFNIFVGLAPGSPTWTRANQADASARRVPSVTQEPRKTVVKGELLIGRIAMLGFAAAAIMEYKWGGEAPLAHLGLVQPGVSLLQAPWWVVGTVLTFLAGGMGLFSTFGDRRRDNDMM